MIGANGQLCTNRYSSFVYKNVSFENYTTATTTPANEIITAGNVYNDHAFITKFSPKGTPLFSFQYTPVYQIYQQWHLRLKFSQIISTKDGSHLVAGYQRDTSAVSFNYVGVLMKIDKYGRVLWNRKFASQDASYSSGLDMGLTNVLETTSGDLIVFLASDFSDASPNYSHVVCLSAQGEQKWATYLAGSYDGGVTSLNTKRGVLQSRDGTLVFSELIYRTDRSASPFKTTGASLHLFALNPSDGKMKWENFYAFPIGDYGPYPEMVGITEKSNGNFVFTTSFIETPEGLKGLNVTTDAKGQLINAHTYQSADHADTKIIGVVANKADQQTLLLTKSSGDLLVKTDAAETPLWQRGLNNSGGLYSANIFTANDKNYAVFGSNFRSRNTRLLLADPDGNIDCVNEAAAATIEPFVLQKDEALKTDPTARVAHVFRSYFVPVRADPWPVEKSTDCEAAPDCCHDVADSSKPIIHVCEGSTYTLPDNTVVKDSGTYYVTYTSPAGCDSIVFYKIKTDKNVAALDLGQSLCFEGKDSLVLKATEGYENYFWNNANLPSQKNSFTVRKEGTYRVTVKNSCGENTDSVGVYNQCVFPTHMPDAFTPNRDGRNDVFRLPPQNKNRFVSLTIFNRWGQVVFRSTDAGKGWDGTTNNLQQETGVYVYYLQLTSLSGEPLVHKGTVLLIR